MKAADDPSLVELATANGVALSYLDWQHRPVEVEAQTVIEVLRALGVDASSPTAVAPLPLPPRTWGWMVQLYSLRSEGSWGMGDYRDLADLVAWSGSAEGGGAGLVLCNPLHAMTPVHPIENSPYFPSSRRFRSPLYLRIEDLPEYAACGAAVRARVGSLRPAPMRERIDRDAVWAAKRAALEALWPYARQGRLAEFWRDNGKVLDDFAVFCALAEVHGRDWRAWPEALRDPGGVGVQAARREHHDRVRFHAWLQLLCDEQLAAAAAAARAAAMPIGVVHDLAVGVDPGGADAWALQGVLSDGATVGCPPDGFNRLGQDWRLPPWDPRRLAAADYQPFREMVRSVLRHAGGIRIDHVMGLFRLWWVPRGATPDRGTYVAYDWRAMLGVLLDEARQAGAVVIGEDLGTVEERVTEALGAVGILGSEVAWFARDHEGEPIAPARWREAAMASVTTHDLPTVAGWLTGEAVRARGQFGQLRGSVTDALARSAAERAALLRLLHDEGLLGDGCDEHAGEVSLALHRLLLASPARLLAVSPGDAVGDLRQANLPGTRDEYPNWRLPLADASGAPVSVAELRGHPGVRRLIELMSAAR